MGEVLVELIHAESSWSWIAVVDQVWWTFHASKNELSSFKLQEKAAETDK